MASFSTKLKRIEPAYFAGDMHDVVSGKSKTFAVHVDYQHHNMDYVINKVEPWNAYKHINGLSRGIYQVAAKDELGAFNKMRNFIDTLLGDA